MIQTLVSVAAAAALGGTCYLLARVADGVRGRNVDGELVWPAADPSWRTTAARRP